MNAKNVVAHIVDWLNTYIQDIPVNGFIVGVSGGVDSALVAKLCALTGKEVILLNMPIRQSNAELVRGQKQIDEIVKEHPNVRGIIIDLTNSFEHFVKTLPESTQKDALSLANLRARLRMATLYAVGQTNRLLVTGTGNKIEDYGIGFFTKYGDGGVDVSPIGDLLKSEVFLLAKHVGVIDEIIQAKPTDGLWGDERNDEDQIGATYDELEFAMNFSGDESQLTERQREVLKNYRWRHHINRHKVEPVPVCDLSGVK